MTGDDQTFYTENLRIKWRKRDVRCLIHSLAKGRKWRFFPPNLRCSTDIAEILYLSTFFECILVPWNDFTWKKSPRSVALSQNFVLHERAFFSTARDERVLACTSSQSCWKRLWVGLLSARTIAAQFVGRLLRYQIAWRGRRRTQMAPRRCVVVVQNRRFKTSHTCCSSIQVNMCLLNSAKIGTAMITVAILFKWGRQTASQSHFPPNALEFAFLLYTLIGSRLYSLSHVKFLCDEGSLYIFQLRGIRSL